MHCTRAAPRSGHLRRPHPDDLYRLEQTLRDLEQGALKALLAYHRGYDPKLICEEDDPVVVAWVKGEHDDAQRLLRHARRQYGTSIAISLTARPWAVVLPGEERVKPGTPGYVWYVEFYMRERYLQVPELWRDEELDERARKPLLHVLVSDISHVTATFPMVEDGAELVDTIGNVFDGVLNGSTRYFDDLADDPLGGLPALDARVQVNSRWSIQLPDNRPVTIFSA